MEQMKKKIYILNGPNLNMLGVREPEHYGKMSYKDVVEELCKYCSERGVEAVVYQSNHEGDLVDMIQKAYYDSACGIVINPAAYTHTSIAILDAVKAVSIPTVEVHIRDVNSREDFRKTSYIRSACIATVSGHGIKGYFEAVDIVLEAAKCE